MASKAHSRLGDAAAGRTPSGVARMQRSAIRDRPTHEAKHRISLPRHSGYGVAAAWQMLKDTLLAFVADEALSRGAAIAFYTVTSIAPVLLIVIAIAGLAFGREAAQNAILGQLSGLMGQQTAEVLQSAVASASGKSAGIVATLIGVVTLIATASGVFGEMQSALNAIWKAKPEGTTVSRLIRARAASLGLVAALGFLLMVSLVVSAGLTAFGNYLDAVLPFGKLILSALNTVLSLALVSALFAAIYKVLPDRRLEWRDVLVGAVVTAVLFTIGKSLIGWYIGSSAVASSFGAAGALIVLLLWVYYSVQIFLLGAEFTKVYANRHGSKQAAPVPERGGVERGEDERTGHTALTTRQGASPTARPASRAWWAIAWIVAAVRLVRELRRRRRPRRS
jgi:membrane protein